MPEKNLYLSILTIGDELTIGQVLNTNVQWISDKLAEIGYIVTAQLTVRDNESDIKSALDFLTLQSSIVLIGGGLGPTHDDITIETLSKYFLMKCVLDQETLKKIETFFSQRNLVMSENNKKQALILENAKPIFNSCGTAPGQKLIANEKVFYIFPGVPHEMKAMMQNSILPELADQNSQFKIFKRTILVSGIGESTLAEKLSSVVTKIKMNQRLSLAFLPNMSEVRIRLQAQYSNETEKLFCESILDEIIQKCGRDFVCYADETLSEFISRNLKLSGKTLSVAESCTGGLIASKLTSTPGSSQFFKGSLVCYQNEIKTIQLGISADEIEDYGVVSKEISQMMSESLIKKWNTDYSLAVTGNLGPFLNKTEIDGACAWISFSQKIDDGTIKSIQYRCWVEGNSRERDKERTATLALDFLRRQLDY